jgi:hypothetical protein
MFILKLVKVPDLDTISEVFLLKGLTGRAVSLLRKKELRKSVAASGD